MKFRNLVKVFREQQGLSREQLARKADVTVYTVWRFENESDNMTPKAHIGSCFAVANALGKSVTDVFFMEK